MRKYILDVNIDVKSDQEGYPAYFFDDLRRRSNIGLVVGGTKYKAEAKQKASLMALFSELISAGRLIRIKDNLVDDAQTVFEAKVSEACNGCPKECDDPHIFALALKGNCPNVITNDKRMATCRALIRHKVGHDVCANIRVICSEAAYKATY